jgi:hypothetical protein
MIKRPLNARFSPKVLDGTKFTTIRSKPWPVYKDIMLYNWSGAAYRSKQIDVCAVMVESENEIIITNVEGIVTFTPDEVDGIPLHVTEGFDSASELQAWFENLVKPGQTVVRHLMRFKKLS